MKKIILLLCTVTLVLILPGCKKLVESLVPTIPTDSIPSGGTGGAITGIGIPVGDPVTKTIGISGGSLASEDGRIQLDIPAGSLAGNTDISIQPVTNEAPGGIGLSYQLLPEGIVFNKPVTIMFHYTDEEINGSHPYFLLVAYQDSAQSWRADRVNRELDTIAKTISIPSTHFSIWSAVNEIRLIVEKDEFKANETGPIVVKEVLDHGEDAGDDLSTLTTSSSVPDNIVSNWTVKGYTTNNALDGQITGSGSKVNYVAPAQIDVERYVQVSAEIKYHLIIYNKGKKIAEFDKFILFATLTLLQEQLEFTLEMQIGDGQLDGSGYGWSYYFTDHAIMDVKVAGQKVTISNIVNYPMEFTPVGGHCSTAYLPDSAIEALNINFVKGYTSEHLFNFDIFSDNSKGPKYMVTCPDGGAPTEWGPDAMSTAYTTPDFKQKDSVQTFNFINEGHTYYYLKYILTPK
jgi:hypothetical protein